MNAYRKRYDTHYAQIMPHITIKSQFEIDDNELDSIKEEVKKRISDIQPVDVHATKASSFAPTTNVIYFKVAKTDSLEKLLINSILTSFMVRLNIHLFRTLQLHKAYQVKNLKISMVK